MRRASQQPAQYAPPPGTRHRGAARLLRRGAIGALIAMLLLALTVTWLLRSGGGRDYALLWVVAALPEGSALTWGRDGALVGRSCCTTCASSIRAC